MAYNITEPNIWFFTTVEERNATGIPRCKLLPDQYVPDGKGGFEPCDVSLNVQTATEPRKANKIGTVFAAKGCRKTTSPASSDYYTTDKENLISMAAAVSSDISDAYKQYLTSAGKPIPVELEDAAPVPKTGGKSLIDKLMNEFPVPTVGSHNFFVRGDLWASLLFNVSKGYNTMLVGESGTGKTELAILLANIMKKTVKVLDMSAKQDPIASLIGVHRFADGKSVFDRADFTFELEKENNIVVFDELPR